VLWLALLRVEERSHRAGAREVDARIDSDHVRRKHLVGRSDRWSRDRARRTDQKAQTQRPTLTATFQPYGWRLPGEARCLERLARIGEDLDELDQIAGLNTRRVASTRISGAHIARRRSVASPLS